jgi:translation initiation factor 3 subunit D
MFDRINTRTERPLQIVDRIRYNPTTSDDPVIQQVCRFIFNWTAYIDPFPQLTSSTSATIFATDNILSLLMCAPRSVYPWDIIITQEGGKLFFDKRDGGPFG